MIKQWISQQFLHLPYEDRAYKSGFIIICAYVVVGGIALLTFGNKALDVVASASVYLIAATFTVAVVIEFWKLIAKALENKYVKWASAGLVFIAYKVSGIKASEVTHQVTSYDPGAFSEATSLLTAFYLPYAWFWLAFSAMVILIMFLWLASPIEEIRNNNRFRGAKTLGRLVGLFVVFVFTTKAMGFYEDEASIPFQFAKYVVLKAEYHQNKSCSNFSDSFYIADVGRGYVSRYNRNTNEFDIYQCDFGVTKQ